MNKSQLSWLLSCHVLLLFSTINNTVLVDAHCLNDQQSYLLQLKSSLEFDLRYSSKLVQWNPEEDCCSWRGVGCDASGRVTALYLNDESITGGADNLTSLFRLQFLEKLNLGDNNFNQIPIPKAIANLTSLVSLDLSHSGFVGPIPVELSSMHNLSIIVLNGNNIFSEVPEFFANLSSLVTLNLLSCNLQGQFPTEIFQVPTLETLDISDNKLLHGSLSPFPKNSSLRTLVLSSTSFSGPLPNSIGNLHMLSTIDLSDCKFNGRIPAALRDLLQLSYVDLSVNNFSGPIPQLQSLEGLVYMDLSHNSLSGSLYSTHFEGVHRLETLNLGYNFFSGSLPSSIFKLPALRSLRLPYNQFSGQIDKIIDRISISGTSLVHLDMSSNHLNGSFPTFLLQLKNVNFSNNKFSGHIPDAIGDLKALNVLDLSHNEITGEIPSSIGKFTNLESLDLSWNQLTGDIPSALQDLTSLYYLNLSFNIQLTGKIPTGSQLQQMSSDSYIGNVGLCGLPLNVICDMPQPSLRNNKEINWMYVCASLGYTTGLGFFFIVLLFCVRLRNKLFLLLDHLVAKVFGPVWKEPIRRL